MGRRYPPWRPHLRLLVLVAIGLLWGCSDGALAPPGLQRRPVPLVQPVTLEQLYWATPAVLPRPRPGVAQRDPVSVPANATHSQVGEALYLVNCAPCHQANGEGRLGRFPALNHNAFVTNQSPQPLIRTVLYGRGVMPGFRATLRDEEIAAVLSYIRTSWNNGAGEINADVIADVAP